MQILVVPTLRSEAHHKSPVERCWFGLENDSAGGENGVDLRVQSVGSGGEARRRRVWAQVPEAVVLVSGGGSRRDNESLRTPGRYHSFRPRKLGCRSEGCSRMLCSTPLQCRLPQTCGRGRKNQLSGASVTSTPVSLAKVSHGDGCGRPFISRDWKCPPPPVCPEAAQKQTEKLASSAATTPPLKKKKNRERRRRKRFWGKEFSLKYAAGDACEITKKL